MQKNNTRVLKIIEKATENLSSKKPVVSGGKVVWVKDGVVYGQGLLGCKLGEVVLISEHEYPALVMQIDGSAAYCVLISAESKVSDGQIIRVTGQSLLMPVSLSIVGRVVDPLGNPLDGGSAIKPEANVPLEAQAPGVMERQPVNQPLQTGILAIDALIPIGRGQRELIIGDRQTGKTTVALDTILAQKDENVICVYVAVGQRDGKTSQVIEHLKSSGAMGYTVVVSASASQPAALQYLAPYAGAAIAEYFMKQGKHTLVVYDDLSKHAVAYREISLLLRRPPGREAYPGDVFYLHSRLLERAARLSDKLGGGSMTALPIIETQAGDVSSYIPTNVISITDGQIFLESKLFNRGIRPAINVGISVSRVGGAAQSPIMKKISGSTKLSLAQYYDLAAFSQFASELDAESKRQLELGRRLVEALKQRPGSPYFLWQEVVLLWAVQEGYFSKYQPETIQRAAEEFLGYLESSEPQIAKQINDERKLTDSLVTLLKQVSKIYFKV